MQFSKIIKNCTFFFQHPSIRKLASSVQDQEDDYEAYDLPDNLTQSAKNMLIYDNEKAYLLQNYLRRFFFREVGFVSTRLSAILKNSPIQNVQFLIKIGNNTIFEILEFIL